MKGFEEESDAAVTVTQFPLEARIQGRLSGRIRDLRLVILAQGIILRGQAHTYYAKQLAQHAVMKESNLPILANEIEVQ